MKKDLSYSLSCTCYTDRAVLVIYRDTVSRRYPLKCSYSQKVVGNYLNSLKIMHLIFWNLHQHFVLCSKDWYSERLVFTVSIFQWNPRQSKWGSANHYDWVMCIFTVKSYSWQFWVVVLRSSFSWFEFLRWWRVLPVANIFPGGRLVYMSG